MKEQVRRPVGWFKLGLFLLSITLSVCNIISTIINGYSLLSTLPLWLPFLVLPILLFFLPIKDVVFMTSLLAAVISSINQTSAGDLQGALFFILALNLYSDKISLFVVLFGVLVGVLGRAFILGMSLFQTVGLLAGFLGCVMLFYIPRVIKDV